MDPRRRARIILIFGVLLALVAAGATYYVASSAGAGTPAEQPTTEVVVAARDIPARTELTANDLKVIKFDASAAPPSAISDPKKAIGQILIQSVAQGEPVLTTKFAPTARAFTVFPPGEAVQPGSPSYRIMTITVADGSAVGGILVPGDAVDIMFVFSFDPTKYIEGAGSPGAAAASPAATPSRTLSPKAMTDQVAKIILGPMKILAREGNVYTIRVDAPLAEQIAYLQASGGSLQFLLRAPTDERAAGTTGATFKEVFGKFKFPIPERIPAPSPSP